MAGFLSGFGSLGLSNLDDEDLFEEKKQTETKKEQLPREEDVLLIKDVECPVCGMATPQKIIKTGKLKLLSTDRDLRPVYSLVDVTKYEVFQCTVCGYAALSKNFSHVSAKQIEMIREGICSRVKLSPSEGIIYSYEEALERFKLALACAMVKKGKVSEKAYICLKSAWLLRGFAKEKEEAGDEELTKEIRRAEAEYLEKAYQGLCKAVTVESFPMCGMDEKTVDYLMAALAFECGRLDAASRMVYKILQDTNSGSRVKQRAYDLKEEILEEVRRRKAKGEVTE